MRWAALVVVLLGGCELAFPLDAPPDPRPAFRRTVFVTPPPSVELSNFPIGVVIEEGLLGVVSDANNMRFVDLDGVELPSELLYDEVAGTLEAWVLIERLQNLSITFEYGGDVEHATNAREVWRPEGVETVASVWHLSGAEPEPADSSRGISVFEMPGSAAEPVSGVIGGARRFDGDDVLCSVSTGNYQFGIRPLSWSVWVNVPANAGSAPFEQPLQNGAGQSTLYGFNFELGTQRWATSACCDSNKTNFQVNAPINNDRWVHLTGVLDPGALPFGELRIYIDRNVVPQTISIGNATWAGVDNAQPVCIGGNPTEPSLNFHGDIDEVRIYPTALTADWIATETFNVANRDQFIELGPPVAVE